MRFRLSLFILLSIFSVGVSVLSAQAALTLEQVVEKIQQKNNATTTLEVHFTQSAYNKSLNQTQKAEGMVYIKKPGMMRWDYAPPDEQSFIVNDKLFWWYTPSTRQVVKKQAEAAFDSSLPLTFISGMGQLNQDFNIKLVTEQPAPGVYALELVPKKPQVNLKKMILKVDDKQFNIQQVVMYDFYDNVTTLDFFKHKLNAPISNERFQFEVPVGVQVVE
jgi:outer membrane lipoprotein carrier protein